jgi:hypothetical protein
VKTAGTSPDWCGYHANQRAVLNELKRGNADIIDRVLIGRTAGVKSHGGDSQVHHGTIYCRTVRSGKETVTAVWRAWLKNSSSDLVGKLQHKVSDSGKRLTGCAGFYYTVRLDVGVSDISGGWRIVQNDATVCIAITLCGLCVNAPCAASNGKSILTIGENVHDIYEASIYSERYGVAAAHIYFISWSLSCT